MKLTNYLKDKITIIIITIISIILITLLDIAFKVPNELIIVTIVLLLLTLIIALLISYFQKSGCDRCLQGHAGRCGCDPLRYGEDERRRTDR